MAGFDGAAPADSAPVPSTDAAGAPVEPAPGDAAAPSPPGDGAAGEPLGAFPLERVQAARAELHFQRGGHLEGISWRGGELLFSAVPGGFYRLGTDQKVTQVLAGPTNGSFVLADGTVLVCDDRNAVVQLLGDGRIAVLGTSGPRCNDLTVDAWGNIYFSDFNRSVYRLTPQGQQTKVVDLNKPNGLEVDPESKFLYILPRPADIYRVALTAEGPVGTPEKLGALDGVTDGCAFDAWGNLWVAVYYGGKIGVFDPARRALLTYVPAGGSGLTNLTFGGPGRDTVFTTVDNKGLHRIPVATRGFPGHPGAATYTVKRYLP